MAYRTGAFTRLWWRWKSLRLPWRKRWLVGFDLAGNTFWEFKDAINAGRVRRIVSYATKTHYGDVNLTPQWVQWLRHTRTEPPSINEQQLDEIRQAQMKELARRADARWAAKPSALDMPATKTQQLNPAPRQDSAPQDIRHQAEVQEAVSEAAAEVAGKTPMEKQEVATQDATPQDTLSQSSSREARPAKVKEYKGYKLGKEGEQAPSSWAPTAARRR